MDQILKKRIFPNNSIKLRPPSPHAPHEILCSCNMCNHFEHRMTLQLLQDQQADLKKKLESKLQSQFFSSCMNGDSNAFEWLLNRLILPTHKIINRGVNAFIPQIIFYKDGEPTGLYMNREINDHRIKKIKRQKINQTYIQKVMNQRRRKYREEILVHLGQKKVQKKKSLFGKKQVRIETKDAAVIQFTDKSEQLITQNQLINLMLKRKQDPMWKKISMIKNFISCKESSRIVKLNFTYDSPLYPDLFTRTRTLMLIYGDNIQPSQKEYITQTQQQQFCNELLKTSVQVFAEYTLYKIVSFVDYFYDDRIDEIQCYLLINQFNRAYLVEVCKIKTQQLVKYNWTQDDYRQKVKIQENRVFKNEKEIKVNTQIINNSKAIEEYMQHKYKAEKGKLGLTLEQQDSTEEQSNNHFFSYLHPQFKHDLSHVLKNEDLSVTDFKKKYLGYVKPKKPIVKPFASSFVRTLHTLTPRLRLSLPSESLQQYLHQSDNPASKTFRFRKVSPSSPAQKRPESLNKTTKHFFF